MKIEKNLVFVIVVLKTKRFSQIKNDLDKSFQKNMTK